LSRRPDVRQTEQELAAVQGGSKEERRTLAFSDYLRTHPSAFDPERDHLVGLH
jgi:GrpB-like predicted nucleotidyltransferase (UPF0157 family)